MRNVRNSGSILEKLLCSARSVRAPGRLAATAQGRGVWVVYYVVLVAEFDSRAPNLAQ